MLFFRIGCVLVMRRHLYCGQQEERDEMPVKKTTRKSAGEKAVKSKLAANKIAKKVTAKHKPVKKADKGAAKTKAAKSAKASPSKVIAEKLTGAQLYNLISARTELSKKQVVSVFEALSEAMEACLKKRGVGEFALPKLCKFVVRSKPATKERKGINPFTGEEILIKAKPARRIVKVRPLKKVKEMAD
jgi:nucleoid DNA-binding protein